ncbi:hypothetical protein GGS23DRAFT_558247 [Durotheca rogersii]|uniref:uncharacterized protein n=1 Tax=Durotheca rogersii TaxID=419775 RepID=UPI002220E757|nr:uncharacterized protein GGS23DRAFT_558247 [Durotheca rogersii]KAI5865222.1 hypothetical protein GGS23DRAFT_558247 [Durotheca rogersii]
MSLNHTLFEDDLDRLTTSKYAHIRLPAFRRSHAIRNKLTKYSDGRQETYLVLIICGTCGRLSLALLLTYMIYRLPTDNHATLCQQHVLWISPNDVHFNDFIIVDNLNVDSYSSLLNTPVCIRFSLTVIVTLRWLAGRFPTLDHL